MRGRSVLSLLLLLALLSAGTATSEVTDKYLQAALRIYPARLELTAEYSYPIGFEAAIDEVKAQAAEYRLTPMDVASIEFTATSPFPPKNFRVRFPVTSTPGESGVFPEGSRFKLVPCEPVVVACSLFQKAEFFDSAIEVCQSLAEARGYRFGKTVLVRVITWQVEKKQEMWLEALLPISAANKKDFAVWCGPGAHEFSVSALSTALWSCGKTLTVLDAKSIETLASKTADCIAFPGGLANEQDAAISETGVKAVRAFVDAGGGYLGICAGAYLASATVQWEGATVRYRLGLYNGTAIGSIHQIAKYPGSSVAGLKLSDMPLFDGLLAHRTVFYFGGPYFEGVTAKDTMATYHINSKPAIISSTFGKGRVVLVGPHIEYDLTSYRDIVGWPESSGVKDPEPDWDILDRLLRLLK